MKKKIYVVRRGRKPGIYDTWGETEKQVKGFSGAEYRSFTYITEKEDEDETVEGSLSYAWNRATEYLGEITEEPEQAKELLDEEYDEKSALNKEWESNQQIFEQAGLKSDAYGNSPWVAALLKYVSDIGFIKEKKYTSRYSCTSIYTALLYLILDEADILKSYQYSHARKQEQLPFGTDDCSVQDIWRESEDYIKLKGRFEEFGIDADDLPEICKRNILKEKRVFESLLNADYESYMAMRRFIRQGKHTIMGLYRELVGNPLYRQELLEISGPFRTPDLETEFQTKENKTSTQTKEIKASMQDIVMRTSAISIALKEKVVGQNDVIDKFEESYFSAEKMASAGNNKKGPRHVYLFAGPSGVGKTFTAKIIADTLGIPYRRFDMSGYSNQNTVTELMGSSTLYKDSKPGVLTDFVRANPRCVLLFDEVEKACKEVILLFLQILDEGKCYDRYRDEDINFQDAIVILTTNAGKQLYQDSGSENLTMLPDDVIIDALKKDKNPNSQAPFFPPEIVSRMSSHTILMFNHLHVDAILKIIKADLKNQIELSKEKYGYDIENGKDMVAFTGLYSMGGSMDARNATGLTRKIIDKGLYKFLTLAEEKMGLDWRNSIRKITWDHDFAGTSDEIRQFYYGEKDCVIAIFGQTEKIQDDRLTENNVQIKITTNPAEFKQILCKENVILTAVDYAYGVEEKESNLSIAEIQTEGSGVFSYIREEYKDSIPVYVLCGGKGYSYSQSEKRKLCSRGVQGFINREMIQTELLEAYRDICCQRTMETLSLRHRRITYDLRNELDEMQKSGRIVFCNFKLEPAIEAEDKDLLLSADTRPNVHWDDIYVSDIVKKELSYFIDFLKNPKEYLRKGVRIPKGVLMYGPAGTGKTSLAKVMATESGVNFLEIGADELAKKGTGEVHRIFRTARKYAPAVLFIDEVDVIGKDRQKVIGGISTTLNALLTEMDGFKRVDDKPIFVMAATNMYEEELDRAFLRRFDRKLFISLPGAKGRKWMLERLIGKHKDVFHVSEKKIHSIVDRSDGKSFADLENVIEAALREAIRADDKVNDRLLDGVFEELAHGEKREGRSLEEIKRTAYHEAGHALISLYYDRVPNYMSIVARGGLNGYMRESPFNENYTKDVLLQKISLMLGGRAAEMVQGYGLTPGASSDLEKATKLAGEMVCRWGMYKDEVGLAVISKEELLYNEKAKDLINQILSEQMQKAVTIINNNKDALERLVKAVMDSETQYLTKEEIEAAYNG